MALVALEWEAGVDRPHAPVDEAHVWRALADRKGMALREILARYLDEDPAGIELRRGAHGKPELADPSSPLRFNLSHSGDLALVAITQGREVGVDIQKIKLRRDVAFYKAWAHREAIVKCAGTGLLAPLPPDPVAVHALDVAPGFAAALAVAGDEVPPLRLLSLAL
jgi:4'-phosphopantetheinyl transferase